VYAVLVETSKNNGLMHCSVQTVAVMCKYDRESVTQFLNNPSEEEQKTF